MKASLTPLFLLSFAVAGAAAALTACSESSPARVSHSSLELCAPEACGNVADTDVVETPCAVSDETEGVACAMASGGCAAQPYFCDEDSFEVCGGIAGAPCGEGEYCAFDGFTCGAGDQTGTCRPLPEVCPEIYAPVCGCDGETYASDCVAAGEGVSVAFHGECGSVGALCGGIAGAACGEGEYCDYSAGSHCGEGDQQGTCRRVPEACTLEHAPVCGCDGETYGNACAAAAAGVAVRDEGACAD